MQGCEFHPWMRHEDWRGDRRPMLIVDLASWPADEPLGPLPPVPVLAVGPPAHPQAWRVDLLAGETISLPVLTARIARMPQACAALVQLLRAIEALPPEQALPIESFALSMLQAGPEHSAWLARQPRQPPPLPGALHLRRAGRTLNLLVDRPAAHNAIDRSMRDALFDAFTLVERDTGIERVKLRARGRCFSTGAELAEFGTTRDPVRAHAIRLLTLPAYPLSRRAGIYDIHVQGACIGAGLELAAFASRLTASPDAWFHLPETGMGIIPGAGGCVSIPRRIGRQRAAALMISGKRIGAATAHRWGLIDAIMDQPSADDRGADQPCR